MPAPLKVLISGGGIAGGVFACSLLRAIPSAKITMVERAPELRLTGAAVDIRNSAVDIIRWLGVEEQIREAGTKEEGMQFVDADGKEIATLAASGRTDVQTITSVCSFSHSSLLITSGIEFNVEEYEIMRGTLAKIFIEPVLERITTVFSESVKAFTADDNGVEVTFTSGKPTQSYDLLVAADGLGSHIRGTLLNAPARDSLHDEGVHVAYFTVKKDLLQGSKLAKTISAVGGRNLMIRPDPDPAGRSSALLMNITSPGRPSEAKARLDEALKGGNESYKVLLQEQFKDVGWLAPDVLEAMKTSDDFYCSLFAQVRSPILSDPTGRVVLLGDAGYATPGMGTSLAIIGGYLLAGEILTHPNDIPAAVKKYEDRIMPLVKDHQGDFPAMQLLNPQTAWGLTIRNWLLWTVASLKIPQAVVWCMSTFGAAEKKFKMEQYPWPGDMGTGEAK